MTTPDLDHLKMSTSLHDLRRSTVKLLMAIEDLMTSIRPDRTEDVIMFDTSSAKYQAVCRALAQARKDLWWADHIVT